MNKIQTNPLLERSPPYKMNNAIVSKNIYQDTTVDQLLQMIEEILMNQIRNIRHWDIHEKLSWAYGFTYGDASMYRLSYDFRRIDVETSHIGTLIAFLSIFTYLAEEPIIVRTYIRRNSFSPYKIRAYAYTGYTIYDILRQKNIVNVLEYIKENRHLFKFFVAGLIDSDGSIQPLIKKRGKGKIRLYFEPEVSIVNKDLNLLDTVNRLLWSYYQIRNNLVSAHTAGCYRIRINSREDIKKLLDIIKDKILNIERRKKAILTLQYLKPLTQEMAVQLKKKIDTLNNEIKIINAYLRILIEKFTMEHKFLYVYRDGFIEIV